MMLEEKECYDIMMQLSAVRSGIDNIMGIMARENIKDCYENPLEDEQAQAERLAQAVQMIQNYKGKSNLRENLSLIFFFL